MVDLQAAYETEMATWGAVLGAANLIYHAAGWLEGGLTASYEKLVLDVEILQNMMEFLRPLPFQEDDLGFEAIKSVPAGGHFLWRRAHDVALHHRFLPADAVQLAEPWRLAGSGRQGCARTCHRALAAGAA